MLLEIVCCSSEDCAIAEHGGASRVELCSAIEMGGLTPSMGCLKRALARCLLPIMAMVRPRSGGFCYAAGEFDEMIADVETMRENGVPGIVFGILTAERAVDEARCRKMVDRAGPMQTVFHRAFDATEQPSESLEALVDLGITRLLTSGQKPTAAEGADLIKRLLEQADGRIEILPASGINQQNMADLIARTGVDQVHLTAFGQMHDASMTGVNIPFNGRSVAEDAYRTVELQQVRSVADALGIRV